MTVYKNEYIRILKKESKFIRSRKEKKEGILMEKLSEKVPDKLQTTLDAAFEKAFSLIFEKGTGIIEKTYNKGNIERGHEENVDALETVNRKNLRSFSKDAGKAGRKNLLISGTAGLGMGALGVGLPDIPLFTAMLLKNVYEIALHFGYDYKEEEEEYFILLLIEGAVSYGTHLVEVDKEIEEFIKSKTIPKTYEQKEQIQRTSRALSRELLYMKFLQGIPIVGAIGGLYDGVYMKRVSEYSRIKYGKRMFLEKFGEGVRK